MTDKRRAFEEKLEAQMKEWNAQIDLLKAKADTASAALDQVRESGEEAGCRR